jgi:hypothetical protein
MMDAAGRLCADPCISVKDIAKAIRLGVESAGNKNLFDLLSSPTGLPLSWKSPIQADWLHKVSPLFVQLSEICPNTVLLSSKVTQAVQNLQQEEVITNNTKMVDPEFWDKCDLAIRILFSMFREVKRTPAVHSRLLKKSSEVQWNAIGKVLNKLKVGTQAAASDSLRGSSKESVTEPFMDAMAAVDNTSNIFKKFWQRKVLSWSQPETLV